MLQKTKQMPNSFKYVEEMRNERMMKCRLRNVLDQKMKRLREDLDKDEVKLKQHSKAVSIHD